MNRVAKVFSAATIGLDSFLIEVDPSARAELGAGQGLIFLGGTNVI